MIHFGDVCKINGAEVPSVDCIIGGSPCQDLSIAGLRKGMLHSELGSEETTRSGLFIEQIRIIKEMRKNNAENKSIRNTRYSVWENVYGALSSNDGSDFRCVLEEYARVAEPGVSIPMPTDGKWKKAGAIIGNGWSLAWRTMDAQFFGVAQRRRRICLVCDFEGYSAPDIVFERIKCGREPVNSDRKSFIRSIGRIGRQEIQPIGESLRWNNQTSKYEREETTRSIAESSGTSSSPLTLQVRCGCEGGGKGALIQEDKSSTLACNNTQTLFQPIVADESYVFGISPMDSGGMKSSNPTVGFYEAETTRTLDLNGANPACNQGGMVVVDKYNVVSLDRAAYNQGENAKFDIGISEDGKAQTIVSRGPGVVSYETVALEGNGQRPSHKGDGYIESDTSYTLNATEVHGVAYSVKDVYTTSHGGFHVNPSVNCANALEASDWKDAPTCVYNSDDIKYVVRRLTPLECTRLQGFPDNWLNIGDWTDSSGKVHKESDQSKYMALGNSIALPQWRFILERMSKYIGDNPTMASLFDGIGGFPLLWEKINGKGTALWAYEIEEFPIAVTKLRIG